MNFVLTEWVNDVKKNQLLNIVGEVGIMHHFSQIVQGVRDLFWIPVYQYRTDGHIIKGVQRGAHSFGISTVVAMLELSQKLVSAIQEFSEVAFEIVNPEYPSGRRQDIFQPVPKPADFREGLSMACSTVKTGFSETAQAIAIATQEERARGRWMIRGILRQATPTIIRPIVIASHATAQMLGGLCSQLKSEAH
ncbi:unnamed protein product [Soboliphyme baturini]|uniref:Autophagy-related protein 2 n=1 Tax=Soboliphyme baturini TaxID=241478 RepID=A0A183J7N6_9BILA|nr:unnamed protein product [Soboliphyme baturini]